MVYSLPDDKILAMFKLKAFADEYFKVAYMLQFFFDRVVNIVGKRRKCWLPHPQHTGTTNDQPNE